MATIDETLAERGARYGDFTDHARVSQILQLTIHNNMRGDPLLLPPFVREGIAMICHKLARIANGDPLYADSWHDIAGYATLIEQRLQPPATTQKEVPPDGPALRSEPHPPHGRCNCPTCNPDGPGQAPQPAGPGHAASPRLRP